MVLHAQLIGLSKQLGSWRPAFKETRFGYLHAEPQSKHSTQSVGGPSAKSLLIHLIEVTWKHGGTAKISTKLEKNLFKNVCEIHVNVMRRKWKKISQ
jgi:hypothetical protein